jgi:tetratricopeptide (TPR) repeat protein
VSAEPLPAEPTGVAAPRQLPAAPRQFVGRETELLRLGELGSGDASGLVLIEGSAGIGKTSLALYWGHRVADRFPDGQLYVNLRGADPSGLVVPPIDALYGFLEALGIAPERIPSTLAARAALYRSVLAGKRILVVLDNAGNAEQVRSLLPGTPGSLVLATSRSQLTSLVATEGAHWLNLGLFSPMEARRLLERSVGAARLAGQSGPVDEIISHCAGLPLALTIVAARAATNPGYPLSTLSEELRDAGGRLDALDGGDSTTDVRSVLSWSYQKLPAAVAQMFRLVSLNPAGDISAATAASLAGVAVRDSRRMLTELTREYLLTEHWPGRFTWHDLVRVYASELLHLHDSENQREQAIRRLLDHYGSAATTASLLVFPHRRDVLELPPVAAGVATMSFGDIDEAQSWLSAENSAILAAIDQAAARGLDGHAHQLACAVSVFYARAGRWQELGRAQRIAVDAAQRLGERGAQAHAHRNAGLAAVEGGDYGLGEAHYDAALALFDAAGDHSGTAQTHLGCSRAMEIQGRYLEALRHAERASDLYELAGDLGGRANALNSVGWCHTYLGQGEPALAACEAALALALRSDNRWVVSAIWDTLGKAHQILGDHARAMQACQRALAMCREIGDRPNEAETLVHVGDAALGLGDADAARSAWQTALRIRIEINHPDIEAVRARIESI